MRKPLYFTLVLICVAFFGKVALANHIWPIVSLDWGWGYGSADTLAHGKAALNLAYVDQKTDGHCVYAKTRTGTTGRVMSHPWSCYGKVYSHNHNGNYWRLYQTGTGKNNGSWIWVR